MSINNLLENIISKSQNKVNFDFSKSYKENSNMSYAHQANSLDLPIEINDSSKWETINHDGAQKLYCQFSFRNYKHLIYFLNEVIKESDRRNHHPDMFISHKDVDVFLYTHALNDITESDISLSKFVMEVFEDIVHF
jgi:pterin-4a-carbinolamine dehydratase|tara:strand:+ start:221 stop:631 length:411 start_codon:yes stop_codon:yes gene_type:complete